MQKFIKSLSGLIVFITLYAGSITAQAVPVLSAKLYAVNNFTNNLVVFDLLTNNLSVVGSLGSIGPTNFGGMAYDSNSQTMYMVGGRNNNNLYTVDINTGSATLIGSHGVSDLLGLAFDTQNNVLYGTQNAFSGASGFFSLNTSTGAATTIQTNIASSGRGIDGLAYDRDLDQLVGLESGGSPSTGGEVFEINRTTGALTSLTTQDRLRIDTNGFAYDFVNQTFWAVDFRGFLFSYDRNNGFLQEFRTVLPGGLAALTFVGSAPPAVVPLPPSLSLFAAGLGFMGYIGWRRKRKVA